MRWTFKLGLGRISLPDALERKYPNVGKEWGWQWVFPATSHFSDRITGEQRRHHLHESVLQCGFKEARLKAGVLKLAGCHTLRHSFATHFVGKRLRHQNNAGITGTQRCQHDNAVHARVEPRG